MLAEVCCVQLSSRVTQLRAVLCGSWLAAWEGFIFLLFRCIFSLSAITHFNRDVLFPEFTEDQIERNGL